MTGGQGSMSKLKAGDVTMWATTTLMDLVGPYAWGRDCPLEKWFRDAKIYQLFEGTAEIQRMVISRMQAREYAERFAVRRRGRRQGDGDRGGEGAGRRQRRLSSEACTARPRPDTRHGFGAHALDARREDSRRRMWVALGDQRRPARRRGRRRHPHRVAGGARRRRAPALRRRLDRPRADRRPARVDAGGRAAGPSATSARRCWRRWSTGCSWSWSASAIAIAAIGRLSDPPGIDGAGVLALGALGLAGNLAATLVLARGQRAGHQPRGGAPPQRRRRARLARRPHRRRLRPRRRLRHRRPDRRPADLGPRPRLLLAPDQGAVRRADGVGAGRPRRRRDGRGDLRRGGGALGPRPPRLDRDRGLRRDRRSRRRRPGRRPRPDPPPARADPARAVRDRAHDAADGGGGRAGPAAGRERSPAAPEPASPVAGTVSAGRADFRALG